MTTVDHINSIDRTNLVFIGRPSKWGNPFIIGKHGTRQQVIAQFESWLLKQPDLLAQLPEIQNKRLGCFCSPLQCHGDVLAKFADNYFSVLA